MPNGYRGNHAATYLNKVEEVHAEAVAAGNQSPPGAPAGPRTIRLPFPASTAHSGGNATGYGNSSNIVADNSDYGAISQAISNLDNRVGEAIYNSSSDIENMCQTVFVFPSATPALMGLSGSIKSSISSFRSTAEEVSAIARTFSNEITSIG